MTDAELVRGIQAGDATLLPALYERCLPLVWRYAYRRLGGDVHTAEDVVSEAFLSAIESISRLDLTRGTLGGWLVGIVRHKIAHLRREKDALQNGQALAGSTAACRTRVDDPPTVLGANEEAAEVLDVLDRLAEEERVALEWKYLDGCSVRQMAGRLGRTEKAIENLLYRARQSFRALYVKRQDEIRGEFRSERS